MALTFREQRGAPVGNSFLQCVEPPILQEVSRNRNLRYTWALRRVAVSALRRHHSLGGFIPYALASLPLPGFVYPPMREAEATKHSPSKDSEASSDVARSAGGCSAGASTGDSPASKSNSEQCAPLSSEEQELETDAQAEIEIVPGVLGEAVKKTTMMVRNLPHHVTQIQFLEELDRHGFEGKYDFAYLPSTFEAKQGKGYAFINFTTEASARAFGRAWHKSRRCGARGTMLNVSLAALQGLEANVKKLAGPRMARIRNPALRPFVLGSEPLAIVPSASQSGCKKQKARGKFSSWSAGTS